MIARSFRKLSSVILVTLRGFNACRTVIQEHGDHVRPIFSSAFDALGLEDVAKFVRSCHRCSAVIRPTDRRSTNKTFHVALLLILSNSIGRTARQAATDGLVVTLIDRQGELQIVGCPVVVIRNGLVVKIAAGVCDFHVSLPVQELKKKLSALTSNCEQHFSRTPRQITAYNTHPAGRLTDSCAWRQISCQCRAASRSEGPDAGSNKCCGWYCKVLIGYGVRSTAVHVGQCTQYCVLKYRTSVLIVK